MADSLSMRLFYGALGIVSSFTRQSRMKTFLDVMEIKSGCKIIDLGGAPEFWNDVNIPLDITIVNLPGVCEKNTNPNHHTIKLIEGDATNLEYFPDNHFDIAFSNSVIEHVGSRSNQIRFAGEVSRLAPAHWVQTPSIWFPIEAHTGIPLWFLLPGFVRSYFHKTWNRRYPEWNQMVLGTTVISKSAFKKYFPESQIRTERLFFIPKSYVALKNNKIL